ncbi:Retrovirus-related Pol polyprotein from transposon TNT 1-94 [Gossypium australe]|uniref:Retrovirus-related Pol polyprotein from transposon TNT 1-94 n=1 Tax=Gossypium australe TaxID=47621 RepID=A0A5B6UI85_9ROSI|nr:Retrovirus-related Pol polyprotein from transposon TNT 1-94 [Gossypium australe]
MRSWWLSRTRSRRVRANFDKSTVECFDCHKLGHYQWECQSKEKNHTEISEEMLLVAWVGQLESDNWFLDSSCSNHMCNRKECFADFNEQFADNVKLGNDATLVVKASREGLSYVYSTQQLQGCHLERGVIMKYVMFSNRIFKIVALPLPSDTTCFNTITIDVGQLWHCCYGHLSFNGLNTLH